MNASPRSSASAPARTVVLLHASGCSARQWGTLAQALRPTHDVHALDLHGHGARGRREGGAAPSLLDDAALALEVLQRAGGGHLVGHSYGGAVALHLAARHPRLVHGLAVYEPVLLHLLAAHAPFDAGVQALLDTARQVRHLVAAGAAAAAAACFVDHWSGPGSWHRLEPPQQRALASRMDTIAAHFETLLGEPLPPGAFERLDMPLLVLHGTGTTAAALLLSRLLQRLLPQASHVGIRGLGHMGPVTDAARVDERLLRFVRGAGGRQTTGEPAPADAAGG